MTKLLTLPVPLSTVNKCGVHQGVHWGIDIFNNPYSSANPMDAFRKDSLGK
ncbi:MAG: hypothetical protein SOX82_07135 [Eubacteriales bacterium]|nr:hypothetical protein [Eubacteriales bacterium]MDY4213441.1 hypothetical protein [Eubacteriales bacterium]